MLRFRVRQCWKIFLSKRSLKLCKLLSKKTKKAGPATPAKYIHPECIKDEKIITKNTLLKETKIILLRPKTKIALKTAALTGAIFEMNIKGRNLWIVDMKINLLFFSKTLNLTNHKWKGGNPNLNNILNKSIEGIQNSLIIEMNKNNLWITRYLKALAFKIKENSQDITSIKRRANKMLVQPPDMSKRNL